MNIFFHKLRSGRKGQIAGALTVTLVLFVVAAFIAVNTGKPKLQERRLLNGAQAAVLAGGSTASVLLNTMANLNDNMILNFAGLTFQMQLMLTIFIVQFVQYCISLSLLMTPLAGWGVMPTLFMDTLDLQFAAMSMVLLLWGATEVGNALWKIIQEWNDKIPKQSRDTARQYAFSNGGVDEPKIPCSESGCGSKSSCDVECYANIETKFDEFMSRGLRNINKFDYNFGTSTVWFTWVDKRTVAEHGDTDVTNTVEVTITPVQKLQLQLITWWGAGTMPLSVIGAIGGKFSILGPIIKLGVLLAIPIIILLFASVAALWILAGVASVMLTAAGIAATGFCICCGIPFIGWACCPFCVYYTAVVAALGPCVPVLFIGAGLFTAGIAAFPPSSVPAFAKESVKPPYPITAQLKRIYDPTSVDYGFYKTNWPTKTASSAANVTGGSIFPPLQYYDTEF